jgi:AraC family transcriptional regulator, ethanolamine operon transcriptional activator
MIVLGSDTAPLAPKMPQLISSRYADVKAQAASVPGHEQVYSQLTCGRFEGILHSHVISPKAAFFIETTNCGIRKQFGVRPEHLRIAYLLDEVTKCNVNGSSMYGDHLFINLPRTEIDLHFGENHQAAWITLDYEQIRRLMPLDDEPRGLRTPGQLQMVGQAACLFRQTLAVAQQEFFKPGAAGPRASTIAAFERILFSLAAWAFTTALGDDVRQQRSSAAHRARLLRKACEIIDGRLTEGLTMSELCRMIGASRRTLENIFIEAFNMPPYQYVRALRLNAVRKALLSEEDANRAIGDIAGRWGIWHLSHFATDYRRMFGELPSQTRGGSKLQLC